MAVAAALALPWPAVAARPVRPFAASSPWNQPLAAGARVAPDSALLVAQLRLQLTRAVPWINTTSYSAPLYVVGPRQARVHVITDTADPVINAAFAAVPLPSRARPAGGTDRSLILWQPATDTMWEFWQLRRAPDGWHARWGGRIDGVSTSSGVFPQGYGTSASGMALAGGLIRPREIRDGRIDHALAMGLPGTAPTFVWPANRSDGRFAGGIPLGTRFRLDPRVDVSALGLPRVTAILARAAQRYGIFVRDTSGAIPFYAQDPVNLRSDPWPRLLGFQSPRVLLEAFPWDRLQVVAP